MQESWALMNNQALWKRPLGSFGIWSGLERLREGIVVCCPKKHAR